MSLAVSFPRPEQIAELTQGLRLPLSAIEQRHLYFIAEMIVRAWSDLRQSQAATLLRGNEAEINALMETRLNNLLEEDPRWEQLIRNVKRGVETISYDGRHLEKRPDLSIHLTRRRPAFPLVVECKLLNAAKQKSEALYCQKGLARFIDGDYAWATREAFMLGYVHDNSSTLLTLAPYLASARQSPPDVYLTESELESLGNGAMDLSKSKHGRKFSYLGAVNRDPEAITIWHLWVSVEAIN